MVHKLNCQPRSFVVPQASKIDDGRCLRLFAWFKGIPVHSGQDPSCQISFDPELYQIINPRISFSNENAIPVKEPVALLDILEQKEEREADLAWDYKRPWLAVELMNQLKGYDVRMKVVGSGSSLEKVTSLCKRYGLEEISNVGKNNSKST